MVRSFVLAHWEMRRICRSRPSLAAVIAVPLAAVAACIAFVAGPVEPVLKAFFPVIATVLGWSLLYVRSFSDRASGFAAGLESTPAGAAIHGGRFFTGIAIAAVQCAIFYLAAPLVG